MTESPARSDHGRACIRKENVVMYHLAQSRATAARPPRRRLPAFALAVLAAGAFAAAAPVAGADAAAAANVTVTSHFVWTATTANSSGDSTFINNAATNGRPGAILFITPNWDQGGVCGCVGNFASVGVSYDIASGRWAIFNEDRSEMPAGVSFNVLVVPTASSSVFVQTATAGNTAGDATFINSPLANGLRGARLMVTPVLNPGGSQFGVWYNHPAGVWYNTGNTRWAIVNEDKAAMTAGVSFNVMVGSDASGGGTSDLQVVRAFNSNYQGTFISNIRTTGNPNAVVFETPNVDPNGLITTWYAHPAGILWAYWSGFGGGQAAVFDELDVPLPANAAFNLIVYQS